MPKLKVVLHLPRLPRRKTDRSPQQVRPPADTAPADTKPADTKPADTKPADTKPAARPAPTRSLNEGAHKLPKLCLG